MNMDVVYKATLRTLASILVAITFLLLLVLASAQQQVLLALQGTNVSYSVARKQMREARDYQRDLSNAQDKVKIRENAAEDLQNGSAAAMKLDVV